MPFAITELGREEPAPPADVRAWRRQFPYGVGGPPPRNVPSGYLVLEIQSHPWVSTRRRFRDSDKKRLEDQLNAVIVAFVRMATGLREFALQKAFERRREVLAQRRRRDQEERRKTLERNVAHLEQGIERWRWRQLAGEFLAFAREQGVRRSLDQVRFAAWMEWAERYINGKGMDAFFEPWRTGDGLDTTR